ncbi:MAG: hypothetical protein KDD66_11595 [Bdellovibrionales bacterium]|nr:hypothetical protein [Bdellovibrionales bacterium]
MNLGHHSIDVDVFGDHKVLDTYRRLAVLLDTLASPPADERGILARLFAELEVISNSSIFGGPTQHPFSEKLEARLGWSEKEPKALSEQDKVAIAETLDEVRLRCIGAAILSKKSGTSDPQKVFAEVSAVVDQVGGAEKSPIVYGPGHVAHAQIGETFVVLLPGMQDPRTLSTVIDHLHQLFEQRGSGKNWVVDFSAVRQMPLLLVANVLTYRQKLREDGSDLFVCWVRADSFRDIFKERMTKAFSLKEMGGFYHSTADPD